MTTYGYLRCSTQEQARSGLGIDAQRSAIEAEATRRSVPVTLIIDDGCSGKDLKRPGMIRLLA